MRIQTISAMKHCPRCGKDKPLAHFFVYKSGVKKGKVHSYCQPCLTKVRTAWAADNVEANRAKALRSYHKVGARRRLQRQKEAKKAAKL